MIRYEALKSIAAFPSQESSVGKPAQITSLVVMATLVAAASIAVAQVAAQAAPPGGFEVASIKPSQSSDLRVNWNGRDFVSVGITADRLFQLAYVVPPFQVVGGPDWMRRDRFEVRAKAPEGPLWETTDPVQLRQELARMLKVLLAQRFALHVREETRTLPVYVLQRKQPQRSTAGMLSADPECGRNRPQTAQPADPEQACGIRLRNNSRGVTTVSARSASIGDLAELLKGFLQRPVLDETKITERVSFELTVGTDQIVSLPPTTEAGTSAGLSIRDALASQLNLTLHADQRPVSVFVIERLEYPTPN